MSENSTNPQNNQSQSKPKATKRPFWKMKRFVIPVILIVLFVIIGSSGAEKPSSTVNNSSTSQTNQVSQTPTTTTDQKPVIKSEDNKPKVSAEYLSALGKATTYSKTMNMSKKGVYNQLTSTIEGFSAESAQYAIDNVQTDWNANALAKAKTYQKTMSMSSNAIKTQLTSTIEGFTEEEANYAISKL